MQNSLQIVQQCIEQVSNKDIFIDNNVDIKVIYKPTLELKTSNPIYIINKCIYELTNDTDNPVYVKCKKKKNEAQHKQNKKEKKGVQQAPEV